MKSKNTLCLLVAALMALGGCAELKDAGREIGHTTRDVTTSIGHATRDTTKAIGHASRDAVESIKDDLNDAQE